MTDGTKYILVAVGVIITAAALTLGVPAYREYSTATYEKCRDAHQECRKKAALAPTERGVFILERQCYLESRVCVRKIPKPIK